MGLNQLTGTPWHVDKFTREEGDKRRHRTRCTHYSDRGCSYCTLYGERCHGTAHCAFYEEKEPQSEDNHEIQPQHKTQQEPQTTTKINTKIDASREYPVGCHVRHVKFGKGKVINVMGDILTVNFYDHGRKDLKASVCKAGNLLVRRPD